MLPRRRCAVLRSGRDKACRWCCAVCVVWLSMRVALFFCLFISFGGERSPGGKINWLPHLDYVLLSSCRCRLFSNPPLACRVAQPAWVGPQLPGRLQASESFLLREKMEKKKREKKKRRRKITSGEKGFQGRFPTIHTRTHRAFTIAAPDSALTSVKAVPFAPFLVPRLTPTTAPHRPPSTQPVLTLPQPASTLSRLAPLGPTLPRPPHLYLFPPKGDRSGSGR